MNIYLVVEGPVGEKRVYAHWVPLLNPKLKVVNSLDEITRNNLYIVSGGGYPNYFETIEAGVNDVYSNNLFDRFVVAVDSEEMSYEEKREEIDEYIKSLGINIKYKIVVQHFCLETWALGNKVIINRKPKDRRVKEYRRYFDVLDNDPQRLPGYPVEGLNRAQFAEKYLRKLLNDKHRNLTYTKSNPDVLLHDLYFERVKNRYFDTGHISSFNDFLEAFV